MSKIDDELAAIQTNLATLKTGIAGQQAQITSQQTQINTLTAEIAAGGLTVAQQAALDNAKATTDTLAATFGPPVPAPPQAP